MSGFPAVAVIGAGYWGRNLVRNFHALGVLQVVCDVDVQVLASMSSQYNGVRTTTSFDDVLRDPALQAIVIATPARLHASLVRQAILAGKDVFVEKPLALTEPEGASLVQLAEERDRILMIGHLLWYHPAVLKLKELVDQGELGRLEYVYSQRLNLGKIRREENILWSFAPHDISVILGLVGEIPERVQAQGGYYLHKQIADITVTCLEFPSGVCAHVFVSWLHPYKDQRLVVVGERKMAVFNDLETQDKLLLYPHAIEWKDNFPIPNHKQAEPVPISSIEPLQAECQHFLDCVDRRIKPRTDGTEALRVLKVLRRCQDALEEQRNGKTSLAPSRNLEEFSSGTVYVHPTSSVDQGATIGKKTKIWHYSHIMAGAKIGSNCTLGQNVFIGSNVIIGNNVKIQNNVSVYEGVELEDEVFCGPSMVFTNVINPRSGIDRKQEFRRTLVKKGATLGASSIVLCGHTIGSYAFVGAGALVTKDVPDYALVLGLPAQVVGWVCRCGIKIHFNSLNGGQVFEHGQCENCGTWYMKRGNTLEEAAAP